MTDLHTDSFASPSLVRSRIKPGQLHRLMETYVDGDERAFQQLHAVLEPRLRARLGRLVRDTAVVDDLVQLTFLRAHAARDRFASLPERADRAVEGWYLAIARNVALDHLRHSYRRDRRHDTLVAKGDVAGMGVPEAEPNAEELQLSLEDGTSSRVPPKGGMIVAERAPDALASFVASRARAAPAVGFAYPAGR
jgi:DNA-directed RNA polymerase specialized sigma24 family protein